jgi:acetyl-CoA carboxylase carboxyltransferase component
MGACTGGSVYSPALSDFIVQVEKTSYLFITGPGVIKDVTGEEISFENLGGSKVHTEKSGVAHFSAGNDQDCIAVLKRFLSYLPQNNREKPPVLETEMIPGERCPV